MIFELLVVVLTHLWVMELKSEFCYGEEHYCYMKDQNPYVYFGSRTAYENVHGEIFHLPGCGVVHIWGLLRHGTRLGSRKYGMSTRFIPRIKNEIIENHEIHKRGTLCSEDIQNLKAWRYNWSENMDYELTVQGEVDMRNLATRLKATFPSFFTLSKENFTFKTSSKSRCQKSAVAFTNGLLNTSVSTLEDNNIVIDDKLLRILENKPVDDHIPEVKKFKKTKYVQKMLEEVRSRLGFTKTLSYNFVKDLYTHCAYENAWVPHSRPGFCAAFTKDHLKIFEYAADLEDYYAQGYGTEKNTQLSCSILEDLLAKIMNAKCCENSFYKGTFYIAHSETLLPTYAQLGLFKDDEPLKYDNYENMETKRKWRSSLMDAFASNLLVILYRCAGTFKILFYVNEKQISMPDCEDEFCSTKILKNMFKAKILNSCTQSLGSISRANINLTLISCISLLMTHHFLTYSFEFYLYQYRLQNKLI